MGIREIRRKVFFCDRCEVELTPESTEIEGVKIPGGEYLTNTCEISISFPRKDDLNTGLSIRWTHLCATCEDHVFTTLAELTERR